MNVDPRRDSLLRHRSVGGDVVVCKAQMPYGEEGDLKDLCGEVWEADKCVRHVYCVETAVFSGCSQSLRDKKLEALGVMCVGLYGNAAFGHDRDRK